jgi:hypothetical protein
MAFEFVLRPEAFFIQRLPAGHRIDLDRLHAVPWYSITRTEDELSIVAPETVDFGPDYRQDGWSCLQLAGTLELSLIGVIAEISRLLAKADISIFSVSSYNTDHILIKTADVATALDALRAAGHKVAVP